MNPPVVTVFGSSQPAPHTPAYERAYQLGHAIAVAGWTLCNGGYGGTMEAAARGARAAGGHTIGVTCTLFGARGGPNQFIQEEVQTTDLLARLATLVRLGQAYAVLPGGTGTLLELAYVWELTAKRLPPRHGAPLVLLGDEWHDLRAIIAREQPEPPELKFARAVHEVITLIRDHWRNADDDDPSPTPA